MILEKAELRKEMLARREELPSEEVRLKSRAVKNRLFNSDFFRRAKIVHFYVAFRNEVETREMIVGALELGKRVVVPVIDEKAGEVVLSELIDIQKDLMPNRFGLMEPSGETFRPVATDALQLLAVPGVVFDLAGNRIGYGKGYYDKLLAKTSGAVVAGLAYDFQVIETLPFSDHDIRMGKIITEYRTIDINPLREDLKVL